MAYRGGETGQVHVKAHLISAGSSGGRCDGSDAKVNLKAELNAPQEIRYLSFDDKQNPSYNRLHSNLINAFDLDLRSKKPDLQLFWKGE